MANWRLATKPEDPALALGSDAVDASSEYAKV